MRAGNEAKYNVRPIELIYNHGFKKHELSLIHSIIEENAEIIEHRWHEYFATENHK